MKLAVLLQCHKSFYQINLLLNAMKHDNITFFIHVDKKSDIADKIELRKNVILLPDKFRVDVRWGQYSIVQATLNLMNYATQYDHYDYFCLMSGQDFPIVSPNILISYLKSNNGKNFVNLFESKNFGLNHTNNYDKRNEIVFPKWIIERNLPIRVIRRLWVMVTGGYNHTYKIFKRNPSINLNFYFGSTWWCIHSDFVNWMNDYLDKNKLYEEFYKLTVCADESFFQTLLMNSPYADTRCDYLHYIDWSEGKNSPKNLTTKDYNYIINSGKMFTRKIDEDYRLIELLIKHIN